MSRVLWGLAGYALFVVAVFLGIATKLDLQEAERRAADAATQRAIWQARYAESASSVKTQTVHVTKWATRYDTLRLQWDSSQSGSTGDSVPDYRSVIAPLIDAADSTIAVCRELVTSCEGLRRAADSLVVSLGAERDAYKALWQKERPTWRSRFGISCGYSLVKVGADIKAGPSCGATFRVWP